DQRRATGGGFIEQVAAHGLQAGGVNKVGGFDLAQLLWRGITEQGGLHNAVFADGELVGLFRNGNLRFQRVAVNVYHHAFIVDVKGTVAGVTDGAVGHGNLKETTAVNGQIQRLVGDVQRAGGKNLLRAGGTHTGTQLQAGWQAGIRRRIGARLTPYLIQQVFKNRAVFFKAGGGED